MTTQEHEVGTAGTQADQRFSRALRDAEELPGWALTRESVVTEAPWEGSGVTTFIVQSIRGDGGGVTTFLQLVDGDGRARIVLPPKVVKRIVGQHRRLHDRSTLDSRRRKRATATRRRRREADEAARVPCSNGCGSMVKGERGQAAHERFGHCDADQSRIP